MKTLLEKVRWKLNNWIIQHLWSLNFLGARLSVVSTFVTPGDTILTATVCRNIKQRYPLIRINCVVKQPELLAHDPALESVNGKIGFWCLDFSYLEILSAKDGTTNVLKPTMDYVRIDPYDYDARVFLTKGEIAEARQRLSDLRRPLVTVNVMSRELVKVWIVEYWHELLALLQNDFDVVQLGDSREPNLEGVTSFAGSLSLRESMATLAQARVHIGPDSFLAHAANGLNVPSVIIYGGSRTPENLGYRANANLYEKVECSPCWLHTTEGERCPNDMICMRAISVQRVYAAVREMASKRSFHRHSPIKGVID